MLMLAIGGVAGQEQYGSFSVCSDSTIPVDLVILEDISGGGPGTLLTQSRSMTVRLAEEVKRCHSDSRFGYGTFQEPTPEPPCYTIHRSLSPDMNAILSLMEGELGNGHEPREADPMNVLLNCAYDNPVHMGWRRPSHLLNNNSAGAKNSKDSGVEDADLFGDEELASREMQVAKILVVVTAACGTRRGRTVEACFTDDADTYFVRAAQELRALNFIVFFVVKEEHISYYEQLLKATGFLGDTVGIETSRGAPEPAKLVHKVFQLMDLLNEKQSNRTEVKHSQATQFVIVVSVASAALAVMLVIAGVYAWNFVRRRNFIFDEDDLQTPETVGTTR